MPAVTIHDELKKELQEIRKKKNFVAKEWADKKAAILNDYCRKHGLKATVVSVSGGVDSSVILALCHHAMSLEGESIHCLRPRGCVIS